MLNNKKLMLDKEIRKFTAKNVLHVDFWGTITLNMNHFYVSNLAAERSRKILKTEFNKVSKNKFK